MHLLKKFMKQINIFNHYNNTFKIIQDKVMESAMNFIKI